MPMYSLIQYSNNHLKTSESLSQYYRVEPNYNIAKSESFKFKVKITKKLLIMIVKNVEIAVLLKYLSFFLENS